ncbi:unnamed protein product [Camellia sinensis]
MEVKDVSFLFAQQNMFANDDDDDVTSTIRANAGPRTNSRAEKINDLRRRLAILFLPTKTNVRMKTIHNEVRALLSNIIKNKERTLKGNHGDNDLLGILLKTNLKESQVQGNKKNIKLTMEEVIVECKLFYLAEQETTSALLVWTMILLSKHQKWQALARDEVLAVFGDNKPNFEGLNQLKTGR